MICFRTSPILITVFEKWVREPDNINRHAKSPMVPSPTAAEESSSSSSSSLLLEEGRMRDYTASTDVQRVDVPVYDGPSGTNVFTIDDDEAETETL